MEGLERGSARPARRGESANRKTSSGHLLAAKSIGGKLLRPES